MSAAQIGGIIGAGLGLVNFAGLRWLADRIDSGQNGNGGRRAAKANMIRLVAIADMIVVPLVGYLVGPLVAGRI